MLKRTRNKVRRFYGDGAYDPWKVRNALENRGIEQVIPPRKDAKIKRHGNNKLPRIGRVMKRFAGFASGAARVGSSASATTAARSRKPRCSA
jgi:hypothetical protein